MPLPFDPQERSERYRRPVPESTWREVFQPGEMLPTEKQHWLGEHGYPDPDARETPYLVGENPTKTSPMSPQQAYEQAKLDPMGEVAEHPEGMISDTKPGDTTFPVNWVR